MSVGMADHEPETLPRLLAKRRETLDKKQSDLAKDLNVTQSAISLWESDEGALPILRMDFADPASALETLLGE